MREVKYIYILVCAVLLLGLQVQPSELRIEGGVGAEIDEIVTIVNDESIPGEYTIRPLPFSEYLTTNIQLSEDRFFLIAQESQNVQIRGEVGSLGPELHVLEYEIYKDEQRKGSFELRIPVEGEAELEPSLSVDAQDITHGNSVVVDVELQNFGNIVAYYNLSLDIRNQENVVGELKYPQRVQVLPGDTKRVSLLYTDTLEPGVYETSVQGLVNEEVSVEQSDDIRVRLASQDRTITVGDDLIVEIQQLGERTQIAYSIFSQGSELFSETRFVEENSVTVPTGRLEQGVYTVEISVVGADDDESQRFTLVVEPERLQVGWLGWLIAAIGLGWGLFSKTSRLHLRIWWLSMRLHMREKRLNRLIYRAHQLESKL